MPPVPLGGQLAAYAVAQCHFAMLGLHKVEVAGHVGLRGLHEPADVGGSGGGSIAGSHAGRGVLQPLPRQDLDALCLPARVRAQQLVVVGEAPTLAGKRIHEPPRMAKQAMHPCQHRLVLRRLPLLCSSGERNGKVQV